MTMTKQETFRNTAFLQTTAYQALKPDRAGVERKEQDHEIRINLPFASIFENLMYVGVVAFETWYVPPHYHTHFELCYVDEGEGWFAIEGYSYPTKKGDLFLTKPGEVHYGAANNNAPYRLYYLGFAMEGISNLEVEYYQVDLQRVRSEQQECIRSLFVEIIREVQGGQAYALEMVQSLFLRLLVSVLRTYEPRNGAQKWRASALSPVIREVLNVLHAESGTGYTIDELAKKVHVSSAHLVREFKRCTGMAPGYYMRTLCLERSRLYLRETTLSISQIADLLRFSSIHAFSTFFKRSTMLSPQEYRKQAEERLLSLEKREREE